MPAAYESSKPADPINRPTQNAFDLRMARYLRMLRRVRESPIRFLAWKARTILAQPLWNSAYRINASRVGNRVLRDLAFGRSDFPHGDSARVFRRDFASVSEQLLQGRPEHVSETVSRAELAVRHKVEILGFGEIDLGSNIDWQRDYISGAAWAKTAALRLDYVRPLENSDVKVPWEIGRLQFLPLLGQAWLFTHRNEFVNSAQAITDDWLDQNPVGIGIGWSCPMEVSIRAMNLVASSAMLWDEMDTAARTRLWRSFETHLSYLRRHLELSDINGNHYLFDLAGIVQLGLILHGRQREVPAWLKRAIATFGNETILQVQDDGVHLENSTNYHRLVTEVVLLTILEMQRANVRIPAGLWSTAERMINFLKTIAGTDGQIPLIADSDTGQSLILGTSDPNDVRPLLAVGAALFQPRGQGPALRTPAEAMWMVGTNLPERTTTGPGSAPRITFDQGGFGVLTRGDSKVVARSGTAGLRGRGGHDHSDLTSFTATLAGHSVVVDPGTSTYTGSREVRRREISATGHNMLLIDSIDPAPTVTGSVMDVVSPVTRGAFEHFEAAEMHTTASLLMSHDGFRELRDFKTYSRQLLLSDDGRALDIIDTLDGELLHRIESFLYFDCGWTARRTGDRHVELFDGVAIIDIELDPVWTAIAIEKAQIAKRYGELLDASRLRVRTETRLPKAIVTRIHVR